MTDSFHERFRRFVNGCQVAIGQYFEDKSNVPATAGAAARGTDRNVMCPDVPCGPYAVPSLAAGWTWPAPWSSARERRGPPMQRTARVVQFVFHPVDLLPHARLSASGGPAPAPGRVAGARLPFLSFEFRDQFFARRSTPARLHAQVMP